MNLAAAEYRRRAEDLAGSFPPLLADAERLARTVLSGSHGRRRAGTGDEFWQYRPAWAGDEARAIDWRRSARSDAHFVREKEWQAAQSVHFWVDQSRSMDFASGKELASKGDRGKLLSLAAAVLLVGAGERVSLAALGTPPRSSHLQLVRIAERFERGEEDADYGAPEAVEISPNSQALFVSDFLGDIAPVEMQLAKMADRGVRGALLQVLDPQEERFPFHGRTIFESMGATLTHETLQADGLRERYRNRLEERKATLERLARAANWQYARHGTGDDPRETLLWLYRALERKR